jgi:hypothetical protein
MESLEMEQGRRSKSAGWILRLQQTPYAGNSADVEKDDD